LTADDVEWADVLNKPTFFSGSYDDLTGKPEWVRPSQGTVNLSEFNNDLAEELPGTVAWINVTNKPTFFSGSFNDLTDRPSIEDLKGDRGRDGTDGQDGQDGASSWSDISGKPTWVATNQTSVNLSGFNNDLPLVGGDVEWVDVLNKPTFFSGSYDDLTGKPEWVRPSQGTVNLSEFNNDLGEELPGTIAWGNVSNKPTFFSGSYYHLTGKPEFADVSWEALRTGDPKTPAASMSAGTILVDASMNPSNNQSLGSTTAQWGSIHGLGVYAGDVDANVLYTGVALFKHPATSGFVVLQPLADLTALEISAHFLPNINELHDLGSESQLWDKVYSKDGFFEDLEVTDDIDLYNDIRFKNSDGDTVARLKNDDDGIEVDGHMVPDGDAEFVLGTIENRWKEIHARDAKFSAIVTDSIATVSITTESIVTETISGPSFFVGPEFTSVNGKQIKSVGLPEIGSDAANKAYVDQRFLDTEIQLGMITGDDKPLLYSGTIPALINGYYETCNFLQNTLIPEPDSFTSLGLSDRPFLGVNSIILQIKDTFIAARGTINYRENRVRVVASPEEDTDAATKGYVDDIVNTVGNGLMNVMITSMSITSLTHVRIIHKVDPDDVTKVIVSLMSLCVTTSPTQDGDIIVTAPIVLVAPVRWDTLTYGEIYRVENPVETPTSMYGSSTFNFLTTEIVLDKSDIEYNLKPLVIQFMIGRTVRENDGITISKTIGSHVYQSTKPANLGYGTTTTDESYFF
jgi:hypothetical protein